MTGQLGGGRFALLSTLVEVLRWRPAAEPPGLGARVAGLEAPTRERLRYLMNLERQLTACIGCGCLSMKLCDLLNPDDRLGTHGQGPVRLHESSPRNDPA